MPYVFSSYFHLFQYYFLPLFEQKAPMKVNKLPEKEFWITYEIDPEIVVS